VTARAFETLEGLGRGARAVFSVNHHDRSTERGRSLERYRRAALTSMTAMLKHGLGIGTGLLSLRITFGYLGRERYGLWMAINALLMWAALADFGLSRGLQSHLSEAHGRDDRDAAGRYVSTGLATFTLLAVAFAALFVPLLWIVPWTRVLNVQDPALILETRGAVAAVAACFLAGFPLSLVPTIYASYQRGYVANLFSIAASIVSLATLLLATSLRLSLPWLIIGSGGVATFMTALNLAYIMRKMPWLRPRLRLVSRRTLRALGGTSVAMLAFQLSSLLINEAPTIIVTQLLGLRVVADYSVFMRVFMLPLIVIQMFDTPLIPAFRESYVHGDLAWLRQAFRRITTLKIGMAAIAAGFYVVFGNSTMRLISGRPIGFGTPMWAAAGFFLLVWVWNGSFNDILIAVDRLRGLVMALVFNGIITPVLMYWFVRRWSVLGVVIAAPVYSLLVTSWLSPWLVRDIVWSPRHSS
jgi:O-antigen/teichoic acid export membrane protein